MTKRVIIWLIVGILLVGMGAFFVIKNLNILADTTKQIGQSFSGQNRGYPYEVRNDDGSSYVIYLNQGENPLVKSVTTNQTPPNILFSPLPGGSTSVSPSPSPSGGPSQCSEIKTIQEQLSSASKSLNDSLKTVAAGAVPTAQQLADKLVIDLRNGSIPYPYNEEYMAKQAFQGFMRQEIEKQANGLFNGEMKSLGIGRWNWRTCGESHNSGSGGDQVNVDFSLNQSKISGRVSINLGGVKANVSHVIFGMPSTGTQERQSRSAATSISIMPMKQENGGWRIDARIPGSGFDVFGAYSKTW